MSKADLQRYEGFGRAKLIEMIQAVTRGTSSHQTIGQLSKLAISELAALLVKVEGRLAPRMAHGVRSCAPCAVRRATAP